MNNVFKSIDNLFETSDILNEPDEKLDTIMRLFNCDEQIGSKVLQACMNVLQGEQEKQVMSDGYEVGGKKYRHLKDHKGYKIYVERTPNGYDVSQSFLVCDPTSEINVQLDSSNHADIEDVIEMIDRRCETGTFSDEYPIRAFKKDGYYEVHPNGDIKI